MLTPLRSVPIAWWLAGSFALYVLAANLVWRLGRLPQPPHAVQRVLTARGLAAIAQFLYYLCIPYLALLAGVLNAHDAGVVALDWPHSWATTALLGSATALLLYLHQRFSAPANAASATPTDSHLASPLSVLWSVAFQQAHWGFYRGGLVSLIGAYWGAAAGLGLVLAEWLLSPAWWLAWSQDERAQRQAFDLALALTTTVLFVLTNNLWACALLHGTLALVFRHALRP